MFKYFRRKFDYKEEKPYENTISKLNESKYCDVNEVEYEFIKLLFELFNQQNLNGYIKLKRLSNRAIDFYYNGYPVGKIKLNGRKTWFTYMVNLYEFEKITDLKQEDFNRLINLWIHYIKMCKF
ncbi:hypothetical protein [Ureibacillus thermosphaericus]|uniref:Uncharacterized protein n=1 Tax=Ureibacillus thermosphaericus TaxID=51173 RepID=A0A840PNV2_URETH|nr:hypothetical protein [Ureibacillus thermosphaericus]MBB5148169.1 hypothetical protein [Ureibacillus thermosphaericus]NKZ31079.1 hypothetical protein [Ureibacillus thermosphaericus]